VSGHSQKGGGSIVFQGSFRGGSQEVLGVGGCAEKGGFNRGRDEAAGGLRSFSEEKGSTVRFERLEETFVQAAGAEECKREVSSLSGERH